MFSTAVGHTTAGKTTAAPTTAPETVAATTTEGMYVAHNRHSVIHSEAKNPGRAPLKVIGRNSVATSPC